MRFNLMKTSQHLDKQAAMPHPPQRIPDAERLSSQTDNLGQEHINTGGSRVRHDPSGVQQMAVLRDLAAIGVDEGISMKRGDGLYDATSSRQ